VRSNGTERRGGGFGAFLIACVVLVAAGCRPDDAKIEASSPAELVDIMRHGWPAARESAGAELSMVASRKPDAVLSVASDALELLDSRYPENRLWSTCILTHLRVHRDETVRSAQSILSDPRSTWAARTSRSQLLYAMTKNADVIHDCHDLVVRQLSDADPVVIHAAVDCMQAESVRYPLDDDKAVTRLLELCQSNNLGWQRQAFDTLSQVTPRLRATVAQGLSTVTVLPGNEKRFAAAVEATGRREDEG
jgi:hypothetical protein